MSALLRTELRKALRAKTFWSALAVGLVFIGVDLWEQYEAIQMVTERVLEWDRQGIQTGLGYNLFLSWMGISGGTYGSSMFYTLWPVLAAMAYGWSYNSERLGGVYDQIVARVGRKRYFLAKHTAVFISGGLAVAVPLLCDLLVMALFYPVREDMLLLDNTAFLCGLYYASPWGWCLARVGMTFLFGGAVACVCHVTGTYLRHGVMVVLVPYAALIVVEMLDTTLRESLYPIEIRYTISPKQMIDGVGYVEPCWLLFGTLALLTLGSYALGYWQVKRHELV